MPNISGRDIQEGLDEIKGQVKSQQTGFTYEVRIRPREEDGTPAYGAIVYYVAPSGTVKTAEYTDGDYVSITATGSSDGPTGGFLIGLYGRVVHTDTFAGDGSAVEEEGTAYAVEVEIETSYPEVFEGVKRAAFVDGEFFVTWKRPRMAAINGYEVSVALKDMSDELFNQVWTGNNPFNDDYGVDVYTDDILKGYFRPGYGQKHGASVYSQAQLPDWDWAIGPLGGSGYSDLIHSVTVYTQPRWESDGKVSHISFPYPPSWIDPPFFGEDPYPNQVAAVRAKGIETNTDFWVDIEQPEDESTWGSNAPTSISIDQAGGEVIEGDAIILEAVVNGTDPDPTVTWSTTGPGIVRAGPRRCVVVANRAGDITATSTADGTVTDTISYNPVSYTPAVSNPSPPPSVEIQSVSPPVSARISWPLPDSKDIGRRVYLSDDPDTVMENPVGTSYGKSLVVGGLETGKTYHGAVASISSTGDVGDSTTTFTLDPKDPSKYPAVIREAPIPEVRLTPGDSYSIDLSNYAHLDGNDTQANLWANASFEIIPLVEGTEISAARPSDSVLELSASTSASTDAGKYVPVLVEITRGPRKPVWIGTLVSVTGTTEAGAPQICGVYSQDLDGTAVDAEKLVGASPSLHREGRWGSVLSQVGGTMSVPSDSGGELAVGSEQPELLVFTGDEGASMILSSPAKEAPATAPQLPAQVSEVERGDEWVTYSDTLIEQQASSSEPWRRAVDGSDLWDLSLAEPPEPVFYAAPEVFDGTWLNEDKFPEDAELGTNYATYRGGLQSPSIQSVTPTVNALTPNVQPGATTLSWDIVIDGEPVTRPVDVEYWEKGTPSKTTTVSGKSGLTLDLMPEVTYVADLFGTTAEFTTRPDPPEITVYGQGLGSGGYEYTYELSENNLSGWTDPFGTTHTDNTVTVQSADPISSHTLVLNWSTDEQAVSTETTWRLPNEKVDVEATAETGLLIPTSMAPSPSFTQEQFAGSREIILQNDVYGEGVWRLSPAGYLPQSMQGTLEDYVDLTFVMPGGEEIGKTAELPRSTELSIEATIRAENGFSPALYGVVRWKE